jgi:hypothetical protein
VSCLPIPPFPAPPDIFPIDLTPPPPPGFAGDLALCCKLISFAWTPNVPIPSASINSGVIAVLIGYIGMINAYLDSLAIRCPRE